MTELVVDRDYFSGADRTIAKWLFAVAFLVFCMIVVGGATRLTDSGLSITEWKPIMGAIPPLSAADWQDAFDKYQEIPEYHHVNKGMSLDEFKFIFWWEWGHRFLGRFIGLAFALPFAWFWYTGRLRTGLTPRLAGILGLGALQGVIGWYMVKSGLVDRVDVSQYRLALHLSVAFLILALLVWTALDLWPRDGGPPRALVPRPARWVAGLLLAAVGLQVVLGAFVAGLKAGLVYNTWPDMSGVMVPEGLYSMSPWYLNLFENVATVQFNHRIAAYVVAILAFSNLALFWSSSAEELRRSALLVACLVAAQIVFGIWTLLAAVPLWLGLVHQGGAAIVLVAAVRHFFLVSRAAEFPSRVPEADQA